MKINPLSQLRVEDFPKEQQKWIGALLQPLNQFLSTVTLALQNRLDFTNNFLGQTQNLSFTYATSTLPLKFSLSMNSVPLSLIVCQATEQKSPVILNVAWQYSAGQILITDISKTVSGATSALVPGNAYTLRVRLET